MKIKFYIQTDGHMNSFFIILVVFVMFNIFLKFTD